MNDRTEESSHTFPFDILAITYSSFSFFVFGFSISMILEKPTPWTTTTDSKTVLLYDTDGSSLLELEVVGAPVLVL